MSTELIKRKILEELASKNLYPYSKFYLRSVKKKSGQYWSNHFSTIGIIGANELCSNYLKTDISSQEGKALIVEIMDYIRKLLIDFQQKSKKLFNLEATPAEGTTYRLAKIDKIMYPEIITAGTNDSPYYTNSSHLPVNYSGDIFKILEHQDELQTKYTGGTTLHLFAGSQIRDIEIVKSVIQKITKNFSLPYFTLSPTFSVCQNHGYISGEEKICPNCGAKTEVYSRVVGYLRPVTQWNKGKQAEFKERKDILF